jgi:hypothetical protein
MQGVALLSSKVLGLKPIGSSADFYLHFVSIANAGNGGAQRGLNLMSSWSFLLWSSSSFPIFHEFSQHSSHWVSLWSIRIFASSTKQVYFHACCMPYTFNPSWFLMLKIYAEEYKLYEIFLRSYIRILLFGVKIFSQHLVLIYPQSTLFRLVDRPSSTPIQINREIYSIVTCRGVRVRKVKGSISGEWIC